LDAKPHSPEEITSEIFNHLVSLAALALEPGEADYLRAQLNGQLRAIRALDDVSVDPDLPITSHGVPYDRDLRADIREDTVSSSELADAILGQAPEVENRYLVVPDIPQEDLE
jgi:aspartyl-tRNA(Asn)/glutamyl-tRNA(Gln) amidotransferase subunit C